jgi:hypothetical protein
MMELVQLTAALVIGSVMISAFFLVLAALFPNRVARAQAAAAAMPGRSAVVGLVNWIFFAAVVMALLSLAQWTGIQFFAVPALVIMAAVLLAAIFGLAGVVEFIGARLLVNSSSVRRTGLGALALGWACALPFVGWFALLPYVLALGLGAFILSLLVTNRQPSRPPVESA